MERQSQTGRSSPSWRSQISNDLTSGNDLWHVWLRDENRPSPISTSKSPGSRLSQDSRDHFAMHVGQAKISPTVAVGQPFVIEPQ